MGELKECTALLKRVFDPSCWINPPMELSNSCQGRKVADSLARVAHVRREIVAL